MKELIERIEGASRPSRHLDTQIAILLDPDAQHIVGNKPGRFPQEPIYGPRSTFWDWACDETKEPPAFMSVPAYTASLDAAMTLARHDGEAFVMLSDAMIQLENDGWPKGEWAKTLPRYVCAAALKARGE